MHSLKDLPTAPEPGLVIAASRCATTPATSLVARDGLTLGELPAGSRRRHRLPAPRRPAARARPRPATSSRSAATSTPGCGWSPTAGTTRSCWPVPGLPRLGRARRGDRGARPAADAARRRAREPSRSSAAPTGADVVAAVAPAGRRRHPGLRSPPSGRCSPRSRPAAPRRSARSPRSSRARTARSSCRCAPSSAASDGAIDLRRSHRRPGRASRAASAAAGRGAARRRRQRDLDQHRPARTCRPATRPRRGERGRPPARRPDCRTALSVQPRPTHTGACLVSPTRSTTPADPTASTPPATSATSTGPDCQGPARVVFVGAGPGDVGLLTVRAVRPPRRGRRRRHRPARREDARRRPTPGRTSRSSTPASATTASRSPTRTGPSSWSRRPSGRRHHGGGAGRPAHGRRPGDLQRPGRGGAGLPQGRRRRSRSCPASAAVSAVPAYAGVPLTAAASPTPSTWSPGATPRSTGPARPATTSPSWSSAPPRPSVARAGRPARRRPAGRRRPVAVTEQRHDDRSSAPHTAPWARSQALMAAAGWSSPVAGRRRLDRRRCASSCPGSRPSRCSAGASWCRAPRTRPGR